MDTINMIESMISRLHHDDIVTSRIILLKLRQVLRNNRSDYCDNGKVVNIFNRIKRSAEVKDYQLLLSYLATGEYNEEAILYGILKECMILNQNKYQIINPITEWDPHNCLITSESNMTEEIEMMVDAERTWLLEVLIPNLHTKSTFAIERPMFIKILEENELGIDVVDSVDDVDDGDENIDNTFLIVKERITMFEVYQLVKIWNDNNDEELQLHIKSKNIIPILILKQQEDKKGIHCLYLQWLCTKLGLTMYIYVLSPGELYAYETISEEQRDQVLKTSISQHQNSNSRVIIGVNDNNKKISEIQLFKILNRQNIPILAC